jgi:hypothetical protein
LSSFKLKSGRDLTLAALKEQQRIMDDQNSKLAQMEAKVAKYTELETRMVKVEAALGKPVNELVTNKRIVGGEEIR